MQPRDTEVWTIYKWICTAHDQLESGKSIKSLNSMYQILLWRKSYWVWPVLLTPECWIPIYSSVSPSYEAKAAKLYDTNLAIFSTDGNLSNLIIVSNDFSATFQLTNFYWILWDTITLKSLVLKLATIRFIQL